MFFWVFPKPTFLSFARPRVKLWITAFWFLFGRPCQGGWTQVHWFWLILWSLLDFDLLCSGANWKTFGGLENNSPEGKINFNLPILLAIDVWLNNIFIIVLKSFNTILMLLGNYPKKTGLGSCEDDSGPWVGQTLNLKHLKWLVVGDYNFILGVSYLH